MKTNPNKPMVRRAKLPCWAWSGWWFSAFAVSFAASAVGAPLQLVPGLDPAQAPPSGGSGDSWAPLISPDGRYVLFASTANNLLVASNSLPIPALFPPKLNVFLRDRTNGTTALVSINLSGVGGGNGDSWPTGLSTNGRYALFESSASDLVPGDTNNATDVFVRDLVAGTTLLVSASTNSGVGNGASRSAAMTPDGRYVAFVSAASNLVPGDTNGIPDVFVRDMQGGSNILVSVGAQAAGSVYGFATSSSESPAMTPDGRYVAFYSTATNLVAGVTNVGDIYVRDLSLGTTVWASTYARTALQAAQGTGSAACYNHVLSADGQFVAYEASPAPGSASWSAGLILRYNLSSGQTDLVSTNAYVPLTSFDYENIRDLDSSADGRFIAFIANTNGISSATTCLEVWDGRTGATTLASGGLNNGVPAGSVCDWPVLDPAGQWVAFLGSAVNLVTNSVVGDYHLYLRDLRSGATTLLDADTNGVGSPLSSATVPALSADGRYAAFECGDSSLVANDRNRDSDVFVRDLTVGVTELISAHDPALASATPNGPSTFSPCTVSADGRFVAFASDADNLAANVTNGDRDIFVRDLASGTNLLVSISTNGSNGDGLSTDPMLSANGRYVAFTSSADNLVTGDTNKASDVFIRDLQAGTTLLVSANAAGTGPGSLASYSPAISSDGRYVLYISKAPDLAAGSFSGENVFVRDVQAGANYALTTTASGILGAAMTPSGRYIAYEVSGPIQYLSVWDLQPAHSIYTTNVLSPLSGYVAISPDGNQVVFSTKLGLFVRNLATRVTTMVGPALACSRPGLRFSADSRWLAYTRLGSSTNQVYLCDVKGGTNLLISHSFNSTAEAAGVSDWPDISADGRFVAFRSAATNLVAGITNGVPEIFLYDRQTGSNSLWSVSRFGNFSPDNRSLSPVFSGDGRTLIFQSWASDLTPQDFNHNGDVFAFAFLYAAIAADPTPGQGVWISWPFAPGSNYRVQFRTGLSGSAWQDLSGTVTNIGNKAYLQDPEPGSGQKFYRIVCF
jgi:Tol biopolymer transport system component